MQHFLTLENVDLQAAFVTIGAFDGVHIGHQILLKQMVQAAHAVGSPAVVVTFFPHPLVVLRGLQTPHYLTGPEERAALLGAAGVDVVITLTFTPEFASLSAREFTSLLSRHLGMRQLWAGFNFALGRNREGDIPTLERLGVEMGFTLHILAPVTQEDAAVSSSQIRALLGSGSVATAARLLGRQYSVEGPVVHGDARGRSIGIPTANIQTWAQQIVPANGVYACWCSVAGERIPSVTNIGLRPTFENQSPQPRIETHLFDFHSELYGQIVRLEFVEFLRPEERFSSVEALLAQIHTDITHAKEILKHDR
jgi:riboflavin kinase / FMN adenylyltransferase